MSESGRPVPRLIFCVGFPGGFTAQCESLAFRLACCAYEDCTLVAADTPEELSLALVGASASSVVVGVRRPSARLYQLLARHAAPFLLAQGNPWSVVRESISVSGLNSIESVRAASNSAALVSRFRNSKGALTIADGATPQPFDAAIAIARHFRFNLTEDAILSVARDVGTWNDNSATEDWQRSLDSKAKELIEGALKAFTDYATTGRPREITWERALFFIGDNPGEPATRAVDIAGQQRCLFYGPYIGLPPGGWIACVTLACTRGSVGMEVVVEVASNALTLTRTRVLLEKPGATEAVLDFVVSEVIEGAIEIRIFNARHAFAGQLGLGRVTLLERRGVGDDHSDMATELGLAVS